VTGSLLTTVSEHLRRPAVPARSLADLASSVGLPAPAANPWVTGVTLDSRRVEPGDLFAALPGARGHGVEHLLQALQRGAAAVLTDRGGAARAVATNVPVLVADAPRDVLGAVAAQVYGQPATDMLMLGVTGTNGKTTTTWLLESGARACGCTTGLIGTVATRIGDLTLPAERTTPEAPDLHALFATMLQSGVDCVAMEVSSHALPQGRVDGIRFDVAAFTNLSQDHLDFHGDMERYFAAKADLFTPARCRSAVIMVDDAWGRRLAASAPVPHLTVSSTPDEAVDWAPTQVRPAAGGGWDVSVRGPDDLNLDLRVTLLGDYNIANGLTALAVLTAAGLDPVRAAAGIGACAGVPGRLEPVVAGQPFLALVDYAHTPDAVASVLATLRTRAPRRLLVVLGAGGDRDHDKRPLMGAAAASGAERVWVTDDNPRSEDAAKIRAAVMSGATAAAQQSGAVVVEVADRRGAIGAAVREAHAGDVVIVVGKGHESGQEIAGVVHPFDDRVVMAEELASLGVGP
jgi:UDP-N-acetylmuramoyl-L-alanyl-D-glutamate--2,6-diaminopimelate ligase